MYEVHIAFPETSILVLDFIAGLTSVSVLHPHGSVNETGHSVFLLNGLSWNIP